MCSIHRHIGLLVLSDSIGVRHRIATEIARISPTLLLRRGAGIEHNNLFYGWPLIEVMCVYIEGSGGGRGDDGGWNRMTAVAVVGLGSPCYMLSHFFFFFILNIYICLLYFLLHGRAWWEAVCLVGPDNLTARAGPDFMGGSPCGLHFALVPSNLHVLSLSLSLSTFLIIFLPFFHILWFFFCFCLCRRDKVQSITV